MADNPTPNPSDPRSSTWRDTLKRPTFWVVVVLLATFSYTQWPTRVSLPETPDYVVTELPTGVQIQWEAEPTRREGEAGPVWHLKRKRMEFLVQSGTHEQPLAELANRMMNVDRDQVNGAVYEPLSIDGRRARYALIDAENRIQRHRVYDLGERWLKTSVLYKAQNEEREQRAQVFLNSVLLIQPQNP
ncbi:hypothetical protein [Saccharospirillum salsuginis]|uniref:Uncharacterized protein n=1 Tax=Saccharospirillum salsuginis TaxID=418750 RepID=A0A918NJW0_9GAMM|nr:hypothetical protein [Saccharospirillum salsuginis]GGX76311.1 hypothetical protein GCM10007392_49110 [Saccharospirillum salsuginis]